MRQFFWGSSLGLPAYLLFCLLPGCFLSPAIAASTVDDLRSVSTSGTGKVFVKPDLATVSIAVQTQQMNVQAAVKENNTKVEKVIQSLRSQGIKQADIKTSGFNIYPVRDYNRTNREQELKGFQVQNTLNVRTKNIDRLGNLLQAVVKAGSNQINGVYFMVDDPSPLLDKARKEAIADARRKAEVLAKAAGAKVGKVLEINEGGTHQPLFRGRRMSLGKESAMHAASSSVPIAEGQEELSVNVQATWALE